MPRNLAREIAAFQARVRSAPAADRDDRVKLVGTTQRRHRRCAALEETPPDDLELPDVCPDCGFQPEVSDTYLADAEEFLKARKRLLCGELETWTTTAEKRDDGTLEAVTRCPDCDAVVRRVKAPDDATYVLPQ
jgi:hypothetical protein